MSPDGKRIAFRSNRSGATEIWLCDSDGSNPQQLTSDSFDAGEIDWSPGGQSIAFSGSPKGRAGVYVIATNGGVPHRLTDGRRPHLSWDGRSIYVASNRGGSSQI
jgi:Tol biopolymer transport system component